MVRYRCSREGEQKGEEKMKINDKVRMNRTYLKIEAYLKNGAITLLEAVFEIDKLWKEGRMNLEEAEAAIKLLARIKKGA